MEMELGGVFLSLVFSPLPMGFFLFLHVGRLVAVFVWLGLVWLGLVFVVLFFHPLFVFVFVDAFACFCFCLYFLFYFYDTM